MSEENQSFEPLDEDIIRYYDQSGESARLSAGIGLLELDRTRILIERFLPDPPAVIADVGGGPGTYAYWLARKGYEVHLVDAVTLHVEQARQASLEQPQAPLASCKVGDARQLDYVDALADAVLLLGPLYHLPGKRQRLAALRECWRIMRPGGILLAVGISCFASLHVGLVRSWIDDPDFQTMVRGELADGQHLPPASRPGLFTSAYFHHPDELEQEIVEAGFNHANTLAVEGAGWLAPDIEQRRQDSNRWLSLLEAVRWTEDERSVLGVSPHIMVVAQKEQPAVAKP